MHNIIRDSHGAVVDRELEVYISQDSFTKANIWEIPAVRPGNIEASGYNLVCWEQ